MSRSLFKVTCLQCHAAFSTPFPQETARLRCPECSREAPGREFVYGHEPAVEPITTQDEKPALFSLAGDTAFERRGKWLLFKCPHCQWAMRIREEVSATSIIDCGRCGLEILPPDPEAGTPATLTRAGAVRLGRLPSAGTSGEGAGTGGRPLPARGIVRSESASETPLEDPVGMWKGPSLSQGRVPADRVTERTLSETNLEEVSRDGGAQASLALDGLIRQARIFRVVMIGIIVILAALGLFLRFQGSEGGDSGGKKAVPGLADRPVDPAAGADPIMEKAHLLAGDLAGRSDWRDILPYVRHRERVEPILVDYYARHPYTPLKLLTFDSSVSLDLAGRRYLQFGALAEEGERRVIGIEATGDGELAFDWEVYEDIAADQWEVFLKKRPIESTVLRFAFCRASVPDEYFADANLAREDGLAVRIWFRDREDSLVAVFPKDSYGGVMIDRIGSWDVGKLVVGELSFPAQGKLPDRVTFEHLLQERWLIDSEKSAPLF